MNQKTTKSLLAAAVLTCTFFAACNNAPKPAETDKNLLPTNLVNNPQTAGGKPTDQSGLPKLSIPDTAYSFGKITQGETVEHEFEFSNSGAAPLLISGAEAGCGCTVTDYPREPIAPGKGGIFKVKFNSTNKMGHQEKMVTISSNAANGVKHVSITADVDDSKK